MPLFNKNLFLALGILFFSCGKEDPQAGFARVTITQIALQKPQPNGRLLTSQTWNHELSPNLTVTFTSQETGQSYPIQLPANPVGFSFDLPLGTYTYQSPSVSSKISTTLPIELVGTLAALSPEVSTELQGTSNYQLLSIQKTNVESAPKILTPQTGVMASQGNFYFIYSSETLKTEILLTNGQQFRLGLDPEAFSHQVFFFPNASKPEDQIGLSDPILNLTQRTIPLEKDEYPSVIPPFHSKELGFPLGETSGLEAIGERLFTLNDGGNLAEIFEISPETGELGRIIKVSNAPNIDWEDIASSDTHIFIGDFGNNLGNRKDLRILKIPILDLLTRTEVTAEILEFSYPEQTVFDDPNHAFDCEAMVFWDGKLHLFTKPTSVDETTHYILNPNLANQAAIKVESFPTAGKITAADITSNGKNLILLGYELAGFSSRAFVEVFTDWNPSQTSNSGKRYTMYLGSVSLTSQAEGISVISDGRIKISGEKISVSGVTIPPRLVEIDLTGLLED